jgi:integrase
MRLSKMTCSLTSMIVLIGLNKGFADTAGLYWTLLDVTSSVTTESMASLTKKPNSQFWFACYRDANGRQHRRSTGVTSERKAREIARTYEQIAQHKLKPVKFRETMVELYREIYGEAVPTATVRQFATNWLNAKKAETVSRSWDSYQKSINKFLAFLGHDAELDISLLTKTHITAFRNTLTQKVSSGTVNFDLRVIKMLTRAARRDGYIQDDPAEFVNVVKSDNVEGRRPLKVKEIKAILSVADDEWRSLIRFGLYTGQRLSDLALLTWANIDLDRNQIRFIARKTSKTMLLPIAETLRQHILSLADSDDPAAPLHPRAYKILRRQKGHGRTQALSQDFGDLLAAAGLRTHRYEKYRSSRGSGRGRGGRRIHSGISFHSLRHTAVSLLKDAGIPEAVVMELVGHDSKQMSALYTHVGREALEKAAAALPEI